MLSACTTPPPDSPVDTPEQLGPEPSRVVASVEAVLTAISEADVELLRSAMVADARIVSMGAEEPEPSKLRGDLDLRRSLPAFHHVLGFVGRIGSYWKVNRVSIKHTEAPMKTRIWLSPISGKDTC